MRITNISLPHPILGLKDDIAGNFTIEPIVDLGKTEISIQIKAVVSNSTIEELIIDKKCSYCVEVHCQNTLYRKSFIFSDQDAQIKISTDELLGKTDVQVFLVATDQITSYHPVGINADYMDYRFNLKKGDVIGYGGSFTFISEKNWRNLKKLASFIVIEKNEDIDQGPVEYDLSGDRILIKLGKRDFEKSKTLQNFPYIPDVFHTAIIYPALLHSTYAMFTNPESYGESKWSAYINQILESNEELQGIDRNDPDSAVKATQAILKDPLTRTLLAIEQLEESASEDPDDLDE
jgi:hypothetical protein